MEEGGPSWAAWRGEPVQEAEAACNLLSRPWCSPLHGPADTIRLSPAPTGSLPPTPLPWNPSFRGFSLCRVFVVMLVWAPPVWALGFLLPLFFKVGHPTLGHLPSSKTKTLQAVPF